MHLLFFFVIAFWDYSYTLSNGIEYNNNIFAYSRQYISDFVQHTTPHKFPFETYDDLITESKLSLRLRNQFFKEKTTTFSVNFHLNHFLINQQKDFQKIKIGLRQSFGKTAAKLYYQLIPEYLIRYYQTPDSVVNKYSGCEVQYQTLGLKCSFFHIKKIMIEADYNYKIDRYIETFSIYNNHSHRMDLGIEIKLSRTSHFDINYLFVGCQNDSASVAASSTEPMPDGDYLAQSIKIGYGFKKKLLLPANISFFYRYKFCNFTTGNNLDSLHYGRQDHSHTISIGNAFRILPGMRIRFAYLRKIRRATSIILTRIGEIKNYDYYKIKSGIEFYF